MVEIYGKLVQESTEKRVFKPMTLDEFVNLVADTAKSVEWGGDRDKYAEKVLKRWNQLTEKV